MPPNNKVSIPGKHHRALLSAVFLAVALLPAAISHGDGALPEPPLVLYGTVTDSGTGEPVSVTSMTWQISGSSGSVAVGTATAVLPRLITAGGQSRYVQEVPFETRTVPSPAGTLALNASISSIGLGNLAPNLTITPVVNGRVAHIAAVNQTPATPGSASTTVAGPSAASQGAIQRIDLLVTSLQPYALWAAGFFTDATAAEALAAADPDADGTTNEQEWYAGTDPTNRKSILSVLSSTIDAAGAWHITFRTVAGKRYQLMASADLATFAPVAPAFTAAGPASPMTVSAADSRKFLRLSVLP